jgi:hypothetical protein
MDTEKQVEVTPEQPQALRKSTLPPLPKWPTSVRGPMVTEPPLGSKPMPLRPEQVAEINYDQERGRHIPLA